MGVQYVHFYAKQGMRQLHRKIEEWLEETDVEEVQAFQFGRTDTNKPSFSAFYREDG